ncbi:MAG: DNA gyrase subunit A [Candidatus Poribacteria bacterium]
MVAPTSERIITRYIEDELKESYLTYAMSVNTNRAIPDVRDGLKPSTRRILYAMRQLGLLHNRPYDKCAAVVGEVMGKYHPHGDGPIYETMVGMAQDFAMRYPLIDGQGNFGCFTGDTKIKLLDGTEKSFAELAELDTDEVFYVYSVDENGRIVIGEGRDARVTRKNARLIELTLDNGETIRCTPDHKFMLRDGTYKAAEHLTGNDSLMPGYFDTASIKDGLNEYLRVLQPATGEYEFVHHLADMFNEQKEVTRQIDGAFVRHHKNFNRWDNRPTNIERMAFLEHLHLHAQNLQSLWEDENFREVQRQGVRRYYDEHPAAREKRRRRFIRQNQDEGFRRENGKRVSARLKRFYRETPEARAEISRRMKALWQEPDYRAKMSEALSGVEKRELTSEEKVRVAQIISEKSRAMWRDEAKRDEIVEAISRAMASEEVRKKLSAAAKRNWRNPDYRAKFPEDHFSDMARALWEKPAMREKHRKKIARQWQDDKFRKAQREGVQRSNRRRMRDNPQMMTALAARSAGTLMEKWADAAYGQQVMRRKISGYGARLLAKIERQDITPAVYEANRDANWIPHIETALQYFRDFDELLDEAEKYNHRVIAKYWLDERADVYDITVDKYHNFLLAGGVFVHNSIDDDPPGAMRYTEARLAEIANEMLADIDKNTVDFQPNYKGSIDEPTVLPARLPNLLVNGSTGIGVGYLTKIPPHNLGEIVDGAIMLLENPAATIDELMKVIHGPDFPTAGLIVGRKGIKDAYTTGKGSVTIRAKAVIERQKNGREQIIISEIPYQVKKNALLNRMSDLANKKSITGITAIRDESDKQIRIVVELRRGEISQVILNRLYKHTQMQVTFGAIMLCLVDGMPKVLNLKEMLWHYLLHRKEVIRRRTQFDLDRCRRRAHLLEGYLVVLKNLEEVIQLIEDSEAAKEARIELMSTFELSQEQADAILDMPLRRLTALERQDINEEYNSLQREMTALEEILKSEAKIQNIVKDELLELKSKYGDERRTEIVEDVGKFRIEDLIADERVVIIITHDGYIKRIPVSSYRRQRRGGIGVRGMQIKGGDFIEHVFIASNHQYILFFTDKGKCYWLKVFEIPQEGRTSRGRAIVNMLRIESDENITAFVPVRQFDSEHYLFMATEKGIVKRCELQLFSRPLSSGIIAINLNDDDKLIAVKLTDGGREILLVTHKGQSIRFSEEEVRSIGRNATGVRGIRLSEDDWVVGMEVVRDKASVLTVTENGYGKRTDISEHTLQGRAGKGIIAIKTTERNGYVVGMKMVFDGDELIAISSNGMVTRIAVTDINIIGRNTQGVRTMALQPDEKVVDITRIAATDESDEDEIDDSDEED